MKKLLPILVAIAVLISLHYPTQEAEAIPAFARKYKISCSTCHVSIPKLKEYGEDFAGNGFVLPDGEEPRRSFIDTGDDALILQRELPIAVRFDAFLQAEDRETAKSDFQTPYGIKLLSGGQISKSISYYFYFYLGERGEVAGLEDAYVHFNNLAKSNFDIMLGQFQVSDPLFKRELRLTFEDYKIYTVEPGNSEANLSYDRGVMLTYGFDFGLDLIGEVLNGNGIGPAEDRLFDFDSNKNFVLRASQSFGPVRIGAFGYFGEEKNEAGYKNSIRYYGPDATVAIKNWELNVQFLHRRDDNPLFMASDELETTLDGGLAELIFAPRGDRSLWFFTALYNRIAGTGSAFDYETLTFSASRLVARNFRILGEVTQDFITDKPRLTVGVVSAF
ncbi:hypothetical protein GWO43_26290 [candidate division KSB1 bacterium]|nr:hypothetical protein [candidate division KSB1 bacterium]NIR69621.1 hypothetical protein [candidate division KSB1 bacterium]NIS27466.1 hypothetical protein [candidate division KSB1 bacterium]NIT74318.1 hypothetical protein [candidate division KSB1 bacterium]NIU28180.1 hypothetical protein [candidate division KSB1 bacterium]